MIFGHGGSSCFECSVYNNHFKSRKMKQQSSGIEILFLLLGSNERYDYRYGLYTTEESSDCFFRLSFNKHSKLYASGISPVLEVVVDREFVDKTTGGRLLEEKRYTFDSLQDLDENKCSWFFPISDTHMQEISDADCIKSITIIKSHIIALDLGSTTGQELWSAFFRAGVAECINDEKDSRELQEYCLQYGLAKKKLELENAIDARAIKASSLAELIAKQEGNIDMI